MSIAPKLTEREYLVIKAHNDSLIEAAKKGAQQCRSIPRNNRPIHISGMLRYWNTVIRSLKWSTGIAAQKAGVNRNARPD